MPGPKPADLTTRVFGRLTPVERVGSTGNNGGALWRCRCDCGKEVTLPASHLTRSTKPSRSCGCLQRERVGNAQRTHGRTKTPEYGVWRQMVARCTKPGHANYRRYGARGVTVCDRWRADFAAFLADMGGRPSPLHTLERKDNDGPYSPENCVWATSAVQMRNTRQNHRLTLRGVTLTVTDWVTKTGIPRSTIYARIRYGWSTERTLTEPVQSRTF